MTRKEFLERARDKHGYKYLYPSLGEKVLSNDIIEILYNGVIYNQRVVKHINLGRCPEKNTPKKTTTDFILESKKIWGENRYDYSLCEYTGSFNKVKLIYDGVIVEQTASTHLRGSEAEFRNKSKDNFIRKAKIIHGDRYDYKFVNFINSDTPIQIGYKGVYYLQKPYSHLSGSKPENQHLSERKTTNTFINESNRVHDFKYSYEKTNYIKNQIKVIITCPIHGDFTQRPLSHTQGSGCPHCNESQGEKKILKYLNLKNIIHSRQHKFSDCRNVFELPFDFYIPSMRTVIEFDGRQHYEPMDHFGGVSAFERLKLNDKIKNDYCEDNYINLIRIRYDQEDRIEEILNENLKTFLNLRKGIYKK